MIVTLAKFDCTKIHDWESFHDEFSRVFGFPAFYGRNMNAWIDCMSSLSNPEDGMTSIHCEKGKMLTIELSGIKEVKEKYPDIYDAIIECSSFVNWRLIEAGDEPVLGLSFYA